MKFKPMLACSAVPDLNAINYPVIASIKLDGIRCVIRDGEPLTRSLKPIPNMYIYNMLKSLDLPDFDGEIMIHQSDNTDFNDVQSGVMSSGGRPHFTYHVFDWWSLSDKGYEERFDYVVNYLHTHPEIHEFVKLAESAICETQQQVEAEYNRALSIGHEGLILRHIKGCYKFGRSTLRQEWMLKLKPSLDTEALVIGFQELLHNNNEPTLDNLGNIKRSDHKDGKTESGMLGALLCVYKNRQFKIGTGFTEQQRKLIWQNQEKYVNKLVKFKYQEITKYGSPRFPVFLEFRDRKDLS